MLSSKKLFISSVGILSLLILVIFLMNPKKTTGVVPYVFTEPAVVGRSPVLLARVSMQQDLRRGLSGQTELKEGTGLLFVFDYSDKHGIWMKDMNFPIDVVWLDSQLNVVFIKKDFSPSSYPEIVYPSTNSSYVLEFPAGFLNTHHIDIGDKLLF